MRVGLEIGFDLCLVTYAGILNMIVSATPPLDVMIICKTNITTHSDAPLRLHISVGCHVLGAGLVKTLGEYRSAKQLYELSQLLSDCQKLW